MGGSTIAEAGGPVVETGALQHVVTDIDGNAMELSRFRGKVVVIVNVASRCGFTGQYAGLEAVYRRFSDKGLVVVGFPSNDFGGQEPGSEAEIKAFCSARFEVSFPMAAKVSVRGEGKCPVFKELTEGTGPFAGEVKWNFTKFVIARDGRTLLGRFGSSVSPEGEAMVGLIERALGEK